MITTNIFEVLGLSKSEDPHDRILAWLLDPLQGHGLKHFAARLIKELWGEPIDEPVAFVKRQFSLSLESYPDIVVQFESSLLVIENKVNASALRLGQLETQNSLATKRQAGKPLYHALLCPDRFRVDTFGPESPSFTVLTYSKLAKLLTDVASEVPEDKVRAVLTDYALFISKSFGQSAPPSLKIASAKTIAQRNSEVSEWSEERFLEQVAHISPSVLETQVELLNLLRSMECVEPRFDSVGPTNATYKVYLAGTDNHPLWVYSDGRLYARWRPLDDLGGQAAVAAYKSIWGGLVNANNIDGSYVTGGLSAVGAMDVAVKLQSLSDALAALPK